MNDIFMALAGLLSAFLVYLITRVTGWVKTKTKTEKENEYIDLLSSTIKECVEATNQTYVNALKAQGNFTLEAQKKAFEMTRDNVVNILSNEAQDALSVIYGDINLYISTKIESEVNRENKV